MPSSDGDTDWMETHIEIRLETRGRDPGHTRMKARLRGAGRGEAAAPLFDSSLAFLRDVLYSVNDGASPAVGLVPAELGSPSFGHEGSRIGRQ